MLHEQGTPCARPNAKIAIEYICIGCDTTKFPMKQEPKSRTLLQTSGHPGPPKTASLIVTDDYHGRRIGDPYRWLENAHAAETQRFVEEQNAYTRSMLDGIPGRDELRRRIEQLLTIGRVASPRVAGDRYFYERRDGRQNQAVVYVREGSSGQGLQNSDRALIDVNDLAPDGTVALDWWYPSEDGRYVAFGTSPNGSELSTLQVINAGSGFLLAETIERTRAASVAWLPDSSGFYYTRYPRPGNVPVGEEMYNRHVFFHPLASGDHASNVNKSGVDASGIDATGINDPLVFPADGIELAPQHWPNVSLSNDGRWLLVEVSEGWTKTELYLKDLAASGSRFQRITGGKNFLYHGEVLDGQLYITTNEDAPRFRVFKAECAAPQRAHWKEIIAESDAVIEGRAAIIGKKLFVHTIKNASSRLKLFNLEGQPVSQVAMPALGSIFDFGGHWNSD